MRVETPPQERKTKTMNETKPRSKQYPLRLPIRSDRIRSRVRNAESLIGDSYHAELDVRFVDEIRTRHPDDWRDRLEAIALALLSPTTGYAANGGIVVVRSPATVGLIRVGDSLRVTTRGPLKTEVSL